MNKDKSGGAGKLFGRVLLLLYMAFVAYFLLFSERYGRTGVSDGYRYNLVLFREITRFWKYRRTLGTAAVAVNLVGNVAAFIPYGFALPVLFKKLEGGFAAVSVCFLTSLAAETVQLVTKTGCFDVDDLLLNTLGGLIGYLVFALARRVRREKSG